MRPLQQMQHSAASSMGARPHLKLSMVLVLVLLPVQILQHCFHFDQRKILHVCRACRKLIGTLLVL